MRLRPFLLPVNACFIQAKVGTVGILDRRYLSQPAGTVSRILQCGNHRTPPQANRNQQPEVTLQGASMNAFTPCDACGMRAYVHVELDTGLPLSFCAHHARIHQEALMAYTVRTIDLTHLLHPEGAR